MKRMLIVALVVLLSVSVVYVTSNPQNAKAYKVNQGQSAKI